MIRLWTSLSGEQTHRFLIRHLSPTLNDLFLCVYLLTLSHFALLAVLNAPAVVIPGNSWVWQARHLAFQHRLLPFNDFHISQRLHKVRHGPLLHLVVEHFRFLWDGRHLLQLGPGGRKEQVDLILSHAFAPSELVFFALESKSGTFDFLKIVCFLLKAFKELTITQLGMRCK